MKDSKQETVRLTRRDALKSAIALVGGSVAVSQLATLATAMAAESGSAPLYLSGEQFAIVKRTADLVIPATDTPGALGAGVPNFIDRMLADWANEDSRAALTRAIEEIDKSALEAHGRPFIELDEGRQFALLEMADRGAFNGANNKASFRTLKALIIFGYYTSEVGASVELRFNPIPGPTAGCVPLEDIGRAWYKH